MGKENKNLNPSLLRITKIFAHALSPAMSNKIE